MMSSELVGPSAVALMDDNRQVVVHAHYTLHITHYTSTITTMCLTSLNLTHTRTPHSHTRIHARAQCPGGELRDQRPFALQPDGGLGKTTGSRRWQAARGGNVVPWCLGLGVGH